MGVLNEKRCKNGWIDYHNKNCNFQILCRDCNLRKKENLIGI